MDRSSGAGPAPEADDPLAGWLRVLVCPECRGDLVRSDLGRSAPPDAPAALACPACRLAYPVVDAVPWMLRERARPLG